jgi:kynureninase
LGEEQFKIITPKTVADRGAQVSIIAKANGKMIFDELVRHNVLGDWREPNVIRLSPVPMYNSFEEVYKTGELLVQICKSL